jgi:putative alpha-1,2-mannosidase
MYGSGVDGLCGNDDAGQMSAWYVFSAMGFYPLCPGSDRYELGSPALQSATINLENGNIFSISTVDQGENKVYVEKVELNGKALDRSYITQDEIMAGGELKFFMTDEIN